LDDLRSTRSKTLTNDIFLKERRGIKKIYPHYFSPVVDGGVIVKPSCVKVEA
jgi:hypothetical protein